MLLALFITLGLNNKKKQQHYVSLGKEGYYDEMQQRGEGGWGCKYLRTVVVEESGY